ncbi:MAG TPA: type II toxin-antitoxin system prevent-host-death family antitoxin [Actinomycetales bacterium]|nr:type II toxin-antitoxin system prevent-host-death family antitoxin [Actinomycetales bacterium]
MDVGIRELKARLSEYVERASRGELVRVTDRGVPRAVLMPLPAGDNVDRGLVDGWIVRETIEVPAAVEPVQPPIGPSTTEILSGDRGE